MAEEVMLRIDPRVTLIMEVMGKDRLSVRCASWTEPLMINEGQMLGAWAKDGEMRVRLKAGVF